MSTVQLECTFFSQCQNPMMTLRVWLQIDKRLDEPVGVAITRALVRLGYQTRWQILLAALFGAPQNRYRTFLCAARIGEHAILGSRSKPTVRECCSPVWQVTTGSLKKAMQTLTLTHKISERR